MNPYEYAEKATLWIDEILPPLQLLDECKKISDENAKLYRNIVGYSLSNHPIEVYEYGESDKCILIYGFPDPGEAIGGTTILSIIKRLVSDDEFLKAFELKWVLIPCLNLEDQPENGEKLLKIMKTKEQEVDWCLDNPREETKALIEVANKYKPLITVPLHDEFHSEEKIPVYFGVSSKIDGNFSNELRQCIENYRLEIDSSICDMEMGYGFFEMSKKADDFKNSTFSILSEYGLVILCELSDIKTLKRSKLCEIQLLIILKVIEKILNKK